MTRTGKPRPLTYDEVTKSASYWSGSHSGPHEGSPDAADLYASAIDLAFNPSDGDSSQESLLVDAVLNAARWIESQPCFCDEPPEPDDDMPCGRCDALGRHRNLVRDR